MRPDPSVKAELRMHPTEPGACVDSIWLSVAAGCQLGNLLKSLTRSVGRRSIEEAPPEGWMVDREGNPLTDPTRQSEGLLLPIGGAKGYGLAMAIGLIAGTLNSAAFGKDVVNFTKKTATQTNTGQFVAAISIEAFADVDTFKKSVDAIFASFRDSDHFPGGDPVRIPGQDRGNIRREREENGIPFHPNLVKSLEEIATELEIPTLASN